MVEPVGTVAGLWRYPVKSMLGEELTETAVGERGLAGDRAYALLDVRTGRVISAKNPKRWPRMFQLRASYPTPPEVGRPPPAVRIELPGGDAILSDDGTADARLSQFLGGDLRLVTGTAGPAAVEVYTPPIPGLVEEVYEFRVPPGPFHDSTPIHAVTAATLARLAEQYPGGRFDVRRFRPNLLVDTRGPPGFVEQAWIGRTLAFGGVRVQVTKPCFRCVMTTLPQGDLPEERGILRTVVEQAGGAVGVKGSVVRAGRVRKGDPVIVS